MKIKRNITIIPLRIDRLTVRNPTQNHKLSTQKSNPYLYKLHTKTIKKDREEACSVSLSNQRTWKTCGEKHLRYNLRNHKCQQLRQYHVHFCLYVEEQTKAEKTAYSTENFT